MNEPMKLVFLTDKLTYGGTPLQMVELASGLNQNEFEPYFIALSDVDDRLQDILLSKHIPVVQIGCSNWTKPAALPAAARLLRTIRRINPRIVHAFLTTSNVLGAVVGKAAHVPVVITSHRDLGGFDGKWITRANRWTDRHLANVLTANSEAVKQIVLNETAVERKRFEVIYNGIDLDKFAQQASSSDKRSELGLRRDDFVIAMVANLRPAKGHEVALRAFAEIADKVPQGYLLFLGAEFDPNYSEKMRQMAQAYQLTDRVLFLGARNDVASILPACDVLLAPSHSEGFSSAILEAMAAGVVVIASAVGGNVEQIVDSETGYLVPPSDADTISTRLLELFLRPELRQKLGKAARDRVQECFCVEKMVERYERLYRSLFRSKPNLG